MSIYSRQWHYVPEHIVKQNGSVKIKAIDLNELIQKATKYDSLTITHRQEIHALHARYAAVNHVRNLPKLLLGDKDGLQTRSAISQTNGADRKDRTS